MVGRRTRSAHSTSKSSLGVLDCLEAHAARLDELQSGVPVVDATSLARGLGIGHGLTALVLLVPAGGVACALSEGFVDNFRKFEEGCPREIIDAGPRR